MKIELHGLCMCFAFIIADGGIFMMKQTTQIWFFEITTWMDKDPLQLMDRISP